ncbi:integrase [Pectobacterium brasiliense]|nr:integrase [Pectobacterium brasiliense]
MDFVADNLFNGRRSRALTVVDNFSRECLAIQVSQKLHGNDVATVMEYLKPLQKRVPGQLQTENGVTIVFLRSGNPTDNALIESSSGSFRDECLNIHWFLPLEDTQEKVTRWRQEYNQQRAYSSLNNQTPAEFARSIKRPRSLI